MVNQDLWNSVDESGNVVLDGSDIAGADGGVTEDQTTGSKQYVVELTLTKDGTTKFAEATAANLKKESLSYMTEKLSVHRLYKV